MAHDVTIICAVSPPTNGFSDEMREENATVFEAVTWEADPSNVHTRCRASTEYARIQIQWRFLTPVIVYPDNSNQYMAY